MKTDPNEPIKTERGTWNDEKNHTFAGRGLTKREYFAAMAMQGLTTTSKHNFINLAEYSVMIADALIKELNNTEKE